MNKLTRLSASIISGLVLPGMMLAQTAFATDTATQPYQAMHKQLGIMSDIIKSSVADRASGKHNRINSIQSTYLRGQGVVFTINASSGSRHWGGFNFVMPVMPVAPLAPSVNDDFETHFELDINETVRDALESSSESYEQAMEQYEHERSSTRELAEQRRELSYQLREIERDARDVNFQLSRASKKDQKELKAELDKLKHKQEKLNKAKLKYKQESNKIIAKQKQKQQTMIKERTTFFDKLTVSLTDTLCLYGNGLKALPKDEHVSLIVKSAGEKEGRRYKDSILVFSKRDITACAIDKIDSATLLKKGQRYQF